MQEADKRTMSREDRERQERFRYTPYKPPEPKAKEERQEKETNDQETKMIIEWVIVGFFSAIGWWGANHYVIEPYFPESKVEAKEVKK